MNAAVRLTRRGFAAGAAAGGLTIGVFLRRARAAGANAPMGVPNEPGPFRPDAFIRIDTAGKTTLVMPQVEMGQGVYTSLAAVLAEELDADWANVTLEAAPPPSSRPTMSRSRITKTSP